MTPTTTNISDYERLVGTTRTVPDPRPDAAPSSGKAPNPKAARAVADGKAPLDYLEPPADAATARVLRTGAAKYGRRNYRDTDMLITTYVGAIRRHAAAWLSGEDLDPDDGEHHLAHIGACVHVCMGAIDADKMVDDRFVMESLPASDAVHIDGDQDAKAGLTLADMGAFNSAHPGCGTSDCCGECSV